jgi:hypothetical protein
MEQNQQSWGQTLFGLFLLALIGGLGYELLKALLGLLLEIDSKIAAAIVAASTTILVSVFSVLISKFLEQRAKINQELREKKIPAYESLIEFVFRLVQAIKKGEELPEEEVEKFMLSFTQQVIVWGSDKVLQAFYNFKNHGDSGDGREAVLRMEDLLLAIRKDLGHANNGLSQGKILGLFINDFEPYPAESALSVSQSSVNLAGADSQD